MSIIGSDLAADLAKALATVQRDGDFFASGTVEIPSPRLEVDGVGVIALPLLPVQATQLIAAAERAPFGRGADTLVDIAVRRSWQIGADRVRIGGKHWARALETMLARAAAGLGVHQPVTAELYKLLIYDEGSFFISHRDTEKSPGMFATLVVVLPSESTGGELVIRHKGREVNLALHCDEPSEAVFAAFYADCLHEVKPVTSGCRLTLVYNLLRGDAGPRPEPPDYQNEQAATLAVLRSWVAAAPLPARDWPAKLVLPLEHAYTEAELGFDKLKGVDAAVAGVLVAVAPQAGCDLHLAQLSIEESGSAEYSASAYARRGRWSDEDMLEVGEVTERHAQLSQWRRPDGAPSALREIPFEDDEICPPDALADLDPDEEHFQEATGNAGASFERTYRRAALVVWPQQRMFAVLNQAGLSVTLPYLEDLTERWVAGGGDQTALLWHQAHDLGGHMTSTWPVPGWYPGKGKGPSRVARMLAQLTRLKDTERIETFAEMVIAAGHHDEEDSEAILAALSLLPMDRMTAQLERIVAATAPTSLRACGALLARAVRTQSAATATGLVGAAKALVDALPGDPSRPPPREPWRPEAAALPSSFIVDLFSALGGVEETLARRAADHVLAWPKTYGLDDILVPAVRQLVEAGAIRAEGALRRLRLACLTHLRARVAEPLQQPQDWRRASDLACDCSHCGSLKGFLVDPERKTWAMKAAEAVRRHVEETIRRAGCDLDVTTDHSGRPYRLVCTKNQASYDRRVRQRRQDLQDLAILDP